MKNAKRKRLSSIISKKNSDSNENQNRKDVRTELLNHEKLIRELRVEKSRTLIDAEWRRLFNEAEVTKVSGSSLEYFGHKRNGQTFLYPEEVLFLVEMNKMQLFYNNVRLSLQRSYCVLLSSIALCQFKVYKYFSVYGYKLMRHEQIYQQPVLRNFEKNAPESTADYDTKRVKSVQLSYDVYLPKTPISKSSKPKPDFHLVISEVQEKLWTSLERLNFSDIGLLFATNNGNTNSVVSIQKVDIPELQESLF